VVVGESTRSTLNAGVSIFLQGDPASHVSSLVNGAVRLVRVLPDGRRFAVGFRFAGDVIGFTASADYPFSAETLTETTVCRIDRRRLAELFRQHPPLEARMLDLCARELATTQDHLLVLARFSAEERVASFLTSLARTQRERGRSGILLEVPATRADLGDLLGLTLETVSRVLSAFRRRGMIALLPAGRVKLLRPDSLAGLARGEGGRSVN